MKHVTSLGGNATPLKLRTMILIVVLFGLTALCGAISVNLFSGFGPVNSASIAGVWTSQYSTPSGNFVFLGLPNPVASGGYVTCSEELVIAPTGRYTQTISFSGSSQSLINSGKWTIRDSAGDQILLLHGMTYLGPYVDLSGLARAINSTGSPTVSQSVSLREPDRGLYFDHWIIGESPGYVYPKDGYVILYPRRGVSNGRRVLVHGTTADESVLEYVHKNTLP